MIEALRSLLVAGAIAVGLAGCAAPAPAAPEPLPSQQVMLMTGRDDAGLPTFEPLDEVYPSIEDEEAPAVAMTVTNGVPKSIEGHTILLEATGLGGTVVLDTIVHPFGALVRLPAGTYTLTPYFRLSVLDPWHLGAREDFCSAEAKLATGGKYWLTVDDRAHTCTLRAR